MTHLRLAFDLQRLLAVLASAGWMLSVAPAGEIWDGGGTLGIVGGGKVDNETELPTLLLTRLL